MEELSFLQEQPYVIQEEFYSDTVMTIIYTSGTTGKPKGVLLTYGNHWSSAVGSALNIGFRENDCWLACLPLFHVGGLSILLKSVIYGMRVVLMEKVDAAALNQAIQERGVTILSVVTKVLTDMVRCLGEGAYPKALRCVLLGGGPAPKPLLEECMKKAIPVYQTYGMTETASQVCTLSSDYMLTKVGSAGKPLFFCQLRIEANGEAAPADVPGEIVVKGPNVAKGYFKRDVYLEDGWLRTGDIGYVDQEGFLYVLDRRSDLIISGGENIYPAQIEEVLLAHPDIEEAGVVGRKDETWGQAPVAFVRKAERSLVTEEELLMFCSKRLARYKIPQEIQFVDELPRNASNKLLRRELKKRAEGELV
jgi:O-succinylbenzoic acid--CoA ligase